jgi:hypothetical protein
LVPLVTPSAAHWRTDGEIEQGGFCAGLSCLTNNDFQKTEIVEQFSLPKAFTSAATRLVRAGELPTRAQNEPRPKCRRCLNFAAVQISL